MSTMLKGVKKSVIRAPHRLIGSKSVEDRIIIEWTKDFNAAEVALDFIISEAKKLISSWKDLVKSQRAMVDLLDEIYAPIQEDNVYTSVQETPLSTTKAIHDLQAKLEQAANQIDPIINELDTSFIGKCKETKKYIDGVQKALTKREHKKIDFDRYSNSAEKLAKKQEMTEKDHNNLSKTEAELDAAMEIFQQQDEKVKTYIPLFLASFSEFLNYLTTTLYLSQQRLFSILKSCLVEYATAQGLLSGKNPPEYTTIVEDWETRFINIQPRCEEGIKTIKEGKTVTNPMTMPSKRIDKVKDSIVHQSGDFAHRVYNRAKHPLISNNITFSSPSQGMFRSEADILAINDPSHASSPRRSGSFAGIYSSVGLNRVVSTSSSGSKGSLTSSGSTSTSPSGLRSPITALEPSPFSSQSITRARAVSSSSAQALSIDEQLIKSAIPPKSENDEYATAKFTFLGDEPGDVSFRIGDKIRVLDHGDETDENWWFGETSDGRVGLFPCNYVEI
ncbi:amphiphysin [Sugiyamaella lignohabitans]|uniref:Amphiphysin n=1 Tax=Sugiyamaella lignohabitans TaxID=796027 RepID=A0A161HFJ9_9ASCO|nr:amphiphysin [Sugiyamaella lignohabitans]ANB14320.1 amphiphysin [Sugiyamaella lignohabitans]